MNKINKKDSDSLSALHGALESERTKYNDLVSDLNARIKAVVDEFNQEHEAQITSVDESYRSIKEQLFDLAKVQVDKMAGYIAERTEKWPSTESGEKFLDWKDAWAEFNDDIDHDLDIGYFEGVDIPESEAVEMPSDKRKS